MLSPPGQAPLKSLMVLCGDHTLVKRLRGWWEKLGSHPFEPPTIANMNILFGYADTWVCQLGLVCFSLLLDSKLPAGHISVRFTPALPLSCAQSPYSENLQEKISGGTRHSISPFPVASPHPKPQGTKCCHCLLPVTTGKLVPWSSRPILKPRNIACHQSPAPSSPQLNEQIRKEN